MNLEQKDILKLTLMAFDNNAANIKNLRQDGNNRFTMLEIDALLKIEKKIDDVKSAIIRILIDAEEFKEQQRENSRQAYIKDNVD